MLLLSLKNMGNLPQIEFPYKQALINSNKPIIAFLFYDFFGSKSNIWRDACEACVWLESNRNVLRDVKSVNETGLMDDIL